MGIMEATSHEHEIDIDKEIAKRAGNDDLAKCISVGNDEDLTVQKVSTIFGFTDFTNSWMLRIGHNNFATIRLQFKWDWVEVANEYFITN